MGPVVTINSATLVNKGLEVIEAHELFGVPYDDIEVMVHPQSVIHSMVEFTDGSTIAQASPPDMRLPIALALGWPDRVPDAAPAVDWTAGAHLGAAPAGPGRVPGRRAGQGGRAGRAAAGRRSTTRPTRSVWPAFTAGRLPFLGIVDTVSQRSWTRRPTSTNQVPSMTCSPPRPGPATRARELIAAAAKGA